MKIRIKRFDKSIPLPERKTTGAAGLDLAARETTIIPAKSFNYVPMNVAVATPPGHFLLMAARSSTHKKGLIMANGIGIGDSDFCGDEDEYRAVFYNFTDEPVTVEKGERVAQLIFLNFPNFEWEEVESLNPESRGGFGSTGA
jgi:dUTP pyrophosphatase